MQRLVAILVLACLLWQQGACCCGDSLALGWAISTVVDQTEAHPHSGCGHHHGCEQPTGSGAPHEHHICVGSHLFFMVDDQPLTLDDGAPGLPLTVLAPVPVLAHLPSQMVVRFRYLAQRPATPALPVRAALQVFVI